MVEQNSFVEGQLSPAEENPAYRAAKAEVELERRQWWERAVFDYAVTFPKYPTKQALIDAFKARLTQLRAIATLPDDDYDAVLFHLILTWNQPGTGQDGLFALRTEYSSVIQQAIQTIPLTAAEVADGIRFFRAQVSRAGA